jgi:hypothetical protein
MVYSFPVNHYKNMTKEDALKMSRELVISEILTQAGGINPLLSHDVEHWIDEIADRIVCAGSLNIEIEVDLENEISSLLMKAGF